ncbi:acetate--CoA ligase family protein [Candidatus Alkanophaga liquidiphilum]
MLRFFVPRGVAVVGASNNAANLGYVVMKNMQDAGFAGKIYPVNPKDAEVLGVHAYGSVSEIPTSEPVDLAVLLIPASDVPNVMRDCAERGVEYVIIESAGFSEAGEAGKRLEEEVIKIAKENSMRVVGPNCLGSINTANNLVSIFVKYHARKGHVAIIAQSGGVGLLLLDWVCENLGLSKFVGLGNKCDVDEADLLEYLAEDAETKVVMIYMEGVKNGRRLLNAVKIAVRKKPVLVLKAGRFTTGMNAAKSHTGAMIADDSVVDAAFKQAGALRAETLEELFDYAKCFATQPLMRGGNIAVMSTSGGLGVVAADALGKYGLSLGKFSVTTLRVIKRCPYLKGNPLDLGQAGGDSDVYSKVLDALLADSNIDGIVIVVVFWAAGLERVVEALKGVAERELRKPVVFCGVNGIHVIKDVEKQIKSLESAGIPTYPSPERAVRALAALRKYTVVRQATA